MTYVHKALWPPSAEDIGGTFLIFFALVLASSGGIGGGGIVTPILLLVFHFNTKFAAPLSNISIFGAACTSLAFNLRKAHPINRNKHLIDWETAAILEPATMLGAIIGAVISHVSSPRVTTPLMIVLLFVMASRYIYLGVVEFKRESAHDAISLLESIDSFEESDTEEGLASYQRSKVNAKPNIVSSSESDNSEEQKSDTSANHSPQPIVNRASLNHTESSPLLNRGSLHLVQEQSEPIPIKSYRSKAILWLTTLLVGILIIYFVIDRILPPSQGRTLSHLGAFLWSMVVFFFIRKDVINEGKMRRLAATLQPTLPPVTSAQDSITPSSNITWDNRNTILLPFISAFAGLIAGLFGVGGGIVESYIV